MYVIPTHIRVAVAAVTRAAVFGTVYGIRSRKVFAVIAAAISASISQVAVAIRARKRQVRLIRAA